MTKIKAQWESDRQVVADRLGVSAQEADRLLDALPYSTIPGWFEVTGVIDLFEELDLLRTPEPPISHRSIVNVLLGRRLANREVLRDDEAEWFADDIMALVAAGTHKPRR